MLQNVEIHATKMVCGLSSIQRPKNLIEKRGAILYNAKLSKWLLGHPQIKLSKERSKRLEFDVEKSIDGFILRYLSFKPKPAHNKT